MNNIRCVIIDDEPKSRELIRSLIEEFVIDLHIAGEADSVASGVALIKDLEPDIVFLDIAMPDGSGFDMLELLDKRNFSVAFITAFHQYAVRAFEYAALYYLLKPIGLEDIEKVVVRFRQLKTDKFLKQKLETIRQNKKELLKIALPVSHGYEFIQVTDILRCEAASSYTVVHTLDKKEMVVSKSISSFEKLLPENYFFRTHKKHLINLSYVKKYFRGKSPYVLMTNDSSVDVAYRRKDEFLERLRSDFGFI